MQTPGVLVSTWKIKQSSLSEGFILISLKKKKLTKTQSSVN